MQCHLTEEELWSGIDRQAPEITEHIASCPDCRERAAQFRDSIEALGWETAAEPPLPERIGAYTIRRRLGYGGMGIVYEGEQASPRRAVAVKVVRGGPHIDEHRMRLLEREAQTLARLRHPAIAAIFEAGRTAEGQPFFAMEMVQGPPLTEYARRNDLSIPMRLVLFQRVCEAIHHAHQRGVIHRDLKPSNILVDANGDPKVLDFGLARITDDEGVTVTMTQDVGRLMGTLPYMSPEEAGGGPSDVDVRSDVYSLGVILYELLTDTLPFHVSRSALPEAVRTICEETPRRPSAHNPALRGDLDTIILKALEKNPARRYQSPQAMADDLTRFLENKPILARRAGLLYRGRKLLVRHRFAFIVGAAVTGVLVAAALWVQQFERQFQSLPALNALLQEQGEALLRLELAQALHRLKEYNKAEQYYRSAIPALERSDREDKVAEARLGLASLLLEPVRSAGNNDYETAEWLLRLALNYYDRDPQAYREERRRALSKLRYLYSPDVWDLPDMFRDVSRELEALSRQVEPDDASRPPLPPVK